MKLKPLFLTVPVIIGLACPALALAGEPKSSKSVSAKPVAPAASTTAESKQKPAKPPLAKRTDLNTASKQQLMTLPGVGANEAEKIIRARPLLTKTQLVSRGVLSNDAYMILKDQVRVTLTQEQIDKALNKGSKR